MLTKNINFKSFKLKKNNKKIKIDLKLFLKENNMILKSLGSGYRNNYNKKILKKFKNFFNIRVIGMGGSTIGTESIYNFLKHKIKKNFYFTNNLQSKVKYFDKKINANIIVSSVSPDLETTKLTQFLFFLTELLFG